MTSELALVAKAGDRSAVIGVVGMGYVGLPLAVAMAQAGYRVVGFDISERVVDGVTRGQSHIKDVAAKDLQALRETDRLTATTDLSRLAAMDAVVICVPTPLSKTKDPDISFIVAAADAVAKGAHPGQLVILESTTYPGTTREVLQPRLEANGLVVGRDIFLAFSPERVDPGNPMWHTRNTPKVIGGVTPACQRVAMAVYEPVFDRLVPVSSPEAAELVKLLENTFRSINIGLVNEMAIICDKLGVDVWEVIAAAGSKPFGFMRFSPGPGIGGHCIPIDPSYLAWKMRGLNYKTRLIDVAAEVNSSMPEFWVRKVADRLNEDRIALKGARVLVVGVAYKRDIDDVRESPALDIIHLLDNGGATVVYHDPLVAELRPDGHSVTKAYRSVALTQDEIEQAHCVVIVTDHRSIDYELLRKAASRIVDTRDVLRTAALPAPVTSRSETPRPAAQPALATV